MSPLATIITCLLAMCLLCLLQLTESCMETAWTEGHLDPDTAIETLTLPPDRGSTCICCAYCNTNRNCSSLSYNFRTRECLLFDAVASYSSIIASVEWNYYVMPSRSHHEEFCRKDTDCLDDGNFCRGRVCTDLTAITCRVIYETFGAEDRLGTHIQMYGYLNDDDLSLVCRMRFDWPGFTRVFRNQRDRLDITRDNVRSCNDKLTSISSVHSSLALAEIIRDLGDDDTYELRTVAQCSDHSAYGDDDLIQSANLTRLQEVLVEIDQATPVSDTFREDFAGVPALSLPYLLSSGDDIINVKINIDLENDIQEQVTLPLARTDGLLWFQTISLYIRE